MNYSKRLILSLKENFYTVDTLTGTHFYVGSNGNREAFWNSFHWPFSIMFKTRSTSNRWYVCPCPVGLPRQHHWYVCPVLGGCRVSVSLLWMWFYLLCSLLCPKLLAQLLPTAGTEYIFEEWMDEERCSVCRKSDRNILATAGTEYICGERMKEGANNTHTRTRTPGFWVLSTPPIPPRLSSR